MIGRIRTAPAAASARVRVSDGGFTLIESLTASAVLLVVSVAVVMTLVATSGWYAKARMRTEANTVANQVMSLILSRNASEIRRPLQGETWPDAIPEQMQWPSAIGTMSVETSLVPVIDPATKLPVTEVIVTAEPLTQPLDPPAMVVRYATGWQEKDQNGNKALVPVQVQIQTNRADLAQSGVRVQLLDTSTMGETYYAVTDGSGIARFTGVAQGQYFLTSDPRFGTDIRPLHFPARVYPTLLGTPGQPDIPAVKYTLEVVRQTSAALLSVGGFQTDGFKNPQFQFGVWNWDIDKPYRPAMGSNGTKLVIYARPVLNVAGTASGVVGAGATYPDESALEKSAGAPAPYSAPVNDYGVAQIVIPWTVDTGAGQYWQVWCTVVDRTSGASPRTIWLNDYASGGWGTPVNQVDLMDQGQWSKLPQFTGLLNTDPVNLPTPVSGP